MASSLEKLGRLIRSLIVKSLLTVVCLAIIGGVGLGFYAYYVNSPRARAARELIETTRLRALEESRRWQERFDTVRSQFEMATELLTQGDGDTPGLNQRIAEIEQKLRDLKTDGSPETRQALADWIDQAHEAIDDSGIGQSALGDRLREALEQAGRRLAGEQTADDPNTTAPAAPTAERLPHEETKP